MSNNIVIPTKPLSEMVVINNGIDYKKNPKGDEEIPIYGTGGIMGYTSIALNEGPAVLSGRKGSINRPFYIEGKFWNVDTIFCLKPLENINAKWLYYSLLNTDMTKLNEATGVPSVTSKSLYRLKINYFEPDKQKKIAKILTTCDTVIEKTQSAIAKYKAIKQGLLHDLFTRGLDANGKLRPSYHDAPELYKESELGMIPKEWEVKRLEEIGDFKNGINKDKESFGNGCLFVNIIDAYYDKLIFDRLGRVNANNVEINNYQLQNDDIIFVRSSVKPEGVGYNTIFSGYKDDVVFCGFMIRFRLKTFDNYNSIFLNYFFRNNSFRKALIAKSTVSANTNINQDSLKGLYAIKPKKEEQLSIVKRLLTIDNKIQTEETHLQKYQSIKRGLMGDLLGGRKELTN
jgi:type I restriction enzyme S subunit